TAASGHPALPRLARGLDVAASLRHRLGSGDATASRLAQLPQLKTVPGALQSTDAAQTASRQAQLPKAICANFAATLTLLGEKDESSADFKQFLQALCGEVAGCLEMAIADSNS